MGGRIKAKGYIFVGLMLAALIFPLVAMFTVSVSERAATGRMVSRIRTQYIAESVIDIGQGLIREQLESMQGLSVYYGVGASGTVIPYDSSPIYQGDPASDFSEIREEAEKLVNGETGILGAVACEISVTGKTPGELMLHTLDKNGDLARMDEYTAGGLLPIEYGITVTFLNIRLKAAFTVSGVEFYLLGNEIAPDGSGGVMTVGLTTENMSIETSGFGYYQNGR